jgi:hypothetical protein
VSTNGAYPDEMNDALVFMDALRATVPAQPDPRLEGALVPRLAATARASTLDAETVAMRRSTTPAMRTARRPRSRLALVARVGIAIALIPLVLAGLAVAGVTVPSPARLAFDSIGVTLPNQPGKHGERGANPQSSQPPVTGTGEAGASSADTKGKSDAAHQHALTKRVKAKGKAIGHARGNAIGLKDLVPPGQSGETGPPAHSNAGGSANGHSSTAAPKSHPTHTPKGVAKGHTKTPPGHSK